MSEYTIDLSAAQNRGELHRQIAAVLPCPEYYGENLDALYDILTERGFGWHIFFSGCAAADAALPVSMTALRRVCADAQAKTPGLKIDYLP